MWDRAHLLLPSGENEDGGESHPADEGQKTHAAQNHDTNKTSSSRFFLPAYKNHQRMNRSRQKNISTSFVSASLSLSLSLSLSYSLSFSVSLPLARARARERERSGKTSVLATSTAAAAELLQRQVMDWGGCFFQATQDSNPRPCQRKSHRGTDLIN